MVMGYRIEWNNFGQIQREGGGGVIWYDSKYVPSTIFQIYRDGSSWVESVLS